MIWIVGTYMYNELPQIISLPGSVQSKLYDYMYQVLHTFQQQSELMSQWLMLVNNNSLGNI